MNKLSVLILTKNEEKNIEECLKSVEWCDEIIIIDDYSTDETLKEIKKLRNSVIKGKTKIFKKQMNNNFAEQRNFGLDKTTGDWILSIDADERMTPELVNSIQHTVNSQNNYFAGYKLRRKNFYFGNNEWPYIEKLERLFRKDRLRGWYGELHESPRVEGEIGELDGFLLHYTHRNLSSMVEKTIEWSKIEAELRLKAGHPKMTWWRFPRVMFGEFFNYYIKQQGFKAGTVGLIESLYQSFSIFITYARLWEMQHEKNYS